LFTALFEREELHREHYGRHALPRPLPV
jgi:hypothetical protein